MQLNLPIGQILSGEYRSKRMSLLKRGPSFSCVWGFYRSESMSFGQTVRYARPRDLRRFSKNDKILQGHLIIIAKQSKIKDRLEKRNDFDGTVPCGAL